MNPNTNTELVDVVDEDDHVIRVVTRAEMRAHRLRHRGVFIAVQHSDGRLLVHQRSFSKDVCPGLWDIAVGGVVASGETYDTAAVRELAEEIGVAHVAPTRIGEGSFSDEFFVLNARCYRVVCDGPFVFADGEVIAARWVNRADLDDLLATNSVMTDSVALLLGPGLITVAE